MDRFSARVITGAGRGRGLGTPTLNVDLNDVPAAIKEGIYAGWVKIDRIWHMAAIHYGPRPVFKDSTAFEAHLLDTMIETPPEILEIVLISRLRDVADFPSSGALMKQIEDDIAKSRAILEAHGSPNA